MSSVQGKEVNALLADHLITLGDLDELKLLIRELKQDIENFEQSKCNYNIGANLLPMKERFLNDISMRVFYTVCIVEGLFKVLNP